MVPCRDIEPQLSLLADGMLPDEAQAGVRAHLRDCAACRGLLTDLERLRSTARSLGPIGPPPAAWPRIEERLRAEAASPDVPARPSRRQALVQWAGLAAALLLVTTVVYLLRDRPAPGATSAGSAATAPLETVTDELGRATVPYENAIRELQAMTAGSETQIVPGVSEAIDTAIADSRAALAANPESESARDSLFEALRRKIALLQTTVSLINDMRAGNQEGAAEAAEKLGKQS